MTVTPAHDSIDFTKDRLKAWRDGGFAFGGPLVILLGFVALGLTVWRVPLELANIATIALTSLTVGGLLATHWRTDIRVRVRRQMSDIRAAAAKQAEEPSWWAFWAKAGSSGQEKALSESQAQELADLEQLLVHNEGVVAKLEHITYFVFMATVVSGGFAIAGELRSYFGA